MSLEFTLLTIPRELLHKGISLRSKRFRGVWKQRKTEQRDFRSFVCAENGARAKKKERGGWERGRKKPPPSFTRSIFRAVVLYSRTPQKRLLRRLGKVLNETTCSFPQSSASDNCSGRLTKVPLTPHYSVREP